MKPETYRKKPVEIEAVRWDGTPAGATPIINWILTTGTRTARWDNNAKHIPGPGRSLTTIYDRIAVETLEGTMYALPGDYIIKGVQGEFYPCKPDIFDQTYEKPKTVGSRFEVVEDPDGAVLLDHDEKNAYPFSSVLNAEIALGFPIERLIAMAGLYERVTEEMKNHD